MSGSAPRAPAGAWTNRQVVHQARTVRDLRDDEGAQPCCGAWPLVLLVSPWADQDTAHVYCSGCLRHGLARYTATAAVKAWNDHLPIAANPPPGPS